MAGPARSLLSRIFRFTVFVYACTRPFMSVVVETCLGWAEAAVLTIVRELSSVFVRVLNGVSGLFVSLFIDRAHWKRHKSAWSDGDVWESRLTEDGVVSTLNAIVEREVSDSSFVSPPGARSRTHRRTPSLRAPENISPQSSPSHNREGILPFWGHRQPNSTNHHGSPIDAGHSPRHTAQLFLAKNYNLSHNALSYDRGVLEETMLNLEVFITRMFENLRYVLVPTRTVKQPEAAMPHRRASFQDMSDLGGTQRMASSRDEKVRLQRTRSAGTMDAVPRKQDAHREGDVSVTDLIRSSGYPAEEHKVTTTDGYRLRMDRIPRSGKRVVFFVHGILDTSLSWVCTGATESQAFAAWDAGCDVWLANSRSNPPRQHVDPAFQGPAYWHYSVNELGLHDLHAQIEHIHNVKCRELGAGIVTIPRSVPLHTGHLRASEEASVAQASKNGPAAVTGATAVLSKKRLVPPTDRETTNPFTASVKHPQRAVGSTTPVDTSAGGSASSVVAQAAIAMTSSLFRASSGGVDPGERRIPTSSRVSWSGASTSSEAAMGEVMRGRQPCRTLPAPDAASAPASIDACLSCCNDTQPQENLPCMPLSEAAVTSSPLLLSPETEFEGACRAFDEHVEMQAQNTLFPNLPTAFNLASPDPANYGSSQEAHSSLRSHHLNTSPDKGSKVFSWLPAGVAVAEQEALELGAQRAGPYFLSSNVPMMDDVVEIDMQGGSHVGRTVSQSAPVSRAALPAAENSRVVPPVSPKTRLPVIPSSPGTPPLQSSVKRESVGRKVWWDEHDNALDAAAVNPNVRAAFENAEHSSPLAAGAAAAPPWRDDPPATEPAPRISAMGADAQEPYTLTGVGHSLGGAALLMYIVQFRRSNRRHRLSRLVLLTPAGFIERLPAILRPIAFVLPTILQLTTRLFPRVLSLPFFVPTQLLRSLMFRLTADMKHLPALTNLVRSCTAFFMNGDSSEWMQSLRMGHYNKTSMPAVSLLQAKHMLQWVNTGRFSMFDYGSRDLNVAAYGQPQPVDIAAEYWRINVPVDFAAGKLDGIITPACVKKHWRQMSASSVPQVTYREFDFGHLDFTFSAKQDLRHHVISCIEPGT